MSGYKAWCELFAAAAGQSHYARCNSSGKPSIVMSVTAVIDVNGIAPLLMTLLTAAIDASEIAAPPMTLLTAATDVNVITLLLIALLTAVIEV